MSSDEKEFGSKGITRRDFLYSTAAAGASVPILKSNKAIQQPPTERKVIPPAEFKSDRDYIEEKIRTGIVPSLVIMVVKDRQTIWAEAFGYADLEKKREANLNSIYKIASISKPITVTGLMTLVDRAALSLRALPRRGRQSIPHRREAQLAGAVLQTGPRARFCAHRLRSGGSHRLIGCSRSADRAMYQHLPRGAASGCHQVIPPALCRPRKARLVQSARCAPKLRSHNVRCHPSLFSVLCMRCLGKRTRPLASWKDRSSFGIGDFNRLKIDPFIDPVRDDPRFAKLLDRLNLPE